MIKLTHVIYAAMLVTPAGLFAQNGYTVTFITNVPGGGTTYATGIDDDGQVAGYIVDSQATHGFILSQGVAALVDQPGYPTTEILGIHSTAGLVGDSAGQDQDGFGFLDARRSITALRNGYGKYVLGANAAGTLVGWNKSTGKGFTYSKGQYTAVDPELCKKLSGPINVVVHGINSNGDLAGYCYGRAETPLGFARIGGKYQAVNMPGEHLFASGINDSGTIAGSYMALTNNVYVYHGFIWTNGNAANFDVPGYPLGTFISGINNQGALAGYVVSSATGVPVGFYAVPN